MGSVSVTETRPRANARCVLGPVGAVRPAQVVKLPALDSVL